ncbi:RNA-binding protein Pasilla [Adelges cooleyi]|uniref:RNA-binding protein Pasilla n=1 Tax=Adelges cooleyi TaxID=133065 RepID=UPI0021808824|nr:RNA-binding protein Pasilla [Adelges cooleyi]
MQFLTGTSQTSAGGGMFGGADGAELYAATASAPDHYFCQRMLYAMQFDSVAAAGAGMCSPLLPSSSSLSWSSPQPPSSSLTFASPLSSSPSSSSSSSSSFSSASSPSPSSVGRFLTTAPATVAAAGDAKMMDACPPASPPQALHDPPHLHHHHGVVENRKRPLPDTMDGGATVKRTHCSPVTGSTDGMYHMKILIPCITAGAIIGKGGETIAQLQTETNTKIKMSKTNDFYPGTTERVCIISGSCSEHIMAALTFIMERIREKPEAANRVQNSADAITDREKQVKILIPNSTAGMIIGKAGTYIKQLKEDSGCFVQISQKAKDTTLQERCITVSGDMDGNKKVCLCILNKIIEDPLSGSCPNLSYADVNGPVANFNPTGSPYALTTTNCSNNQTSYSLNTTTLSPQEVSNGIFSNKFLDNVKPLLRSSGYPESAVGEIAVAFLTLAKHSVLSPSTIIALINQTNVLQAPSMAAHHNGTGLLSAVTNDLFDLGLAGGAISINAILSQNAASPSLANANSYGLGVAAAAAAAAAPKPMGPTSTAAAVAAAAALFEMADDQQQSVKREMDVPESIVGAIIGPGGRSLVEIQQMSGVTIHISKKGVYAPGTTNRKVTICGSAGGIAMANYLMQQRIVEEETKRARAF